MWKSIKLLAIVLLLVSVAGVVGYRLLQVYGAKQSAETRPGTTSQPNVAGRLVNVSVTQARAGQVRDALAITGSLKSTEQVDIGSKVTGRLLRLSCQVGDFVRKGQIIAELESSELAEQVRRAQAAEAVVRATLQQRKAELASASADLDRARQLQSAGLISRQDFDTRSTVHEVMRSQIALAQAQGEQAAAELRELKIRLDQMKITAPISGYVAQKYVEVGAVVNPTAPIVRLVNLNTLVVMANVPERQLGNLPVGSSATVQVDALPDVTLPGRVVRIGPVLDAATRTALVEIQIPNKNGQLRAEMFARVKLDLPKMRQTILIPRDALVYRGNQAGVFVVQQQRPEFRAVEVGITDGQHVEVLGLGAGTTVVNRGAALLAEGDRIRVLEPTDAERIERDQTKAAL